MAKHVHILKTCSLLTERGIEVGDKLEVINEGPSDQRKGQMTYLVKGKTGTPIIVYGDEVSIINA